MKNTVALFILTIFSANALATDSIFSEIGTLSQVLEHANIHRLEGATVSSLSVERINWAEVSPIENIYFVELTYFPVLTKSELEGEGGPGICQATLVFKSPTVCGRDLLSCQPKIKIDSNLCFL